MGSGEKRNPNSPAKCPSLLLTEYQGSLGRQIEVYLPSTAKKEAAVLKTEELEIASFYERRGCLH